MVDFNIKILFYFHNSYLCIVRCQASIDDIFINRCSYVYSHSRHIYTSSVSRCVVLSSTMLWFARWNGWQDVDDVGVDSDVGVSTNRCTLASKLMLSGAALILIVGVVLTLTMVSSNMNMEMYRPFVLTVLGSRFVLFIYRVFYRYITYYCRTDGRMSSSSQRVR